MEDLSNGAAEAAPETSSVAEALEARQPAPEPEAQPQAEAEAPAEKPRSARDAVRDALARTDGDGQPRGPDGRFQPKDADGEPQATPDAKSAEPKAEKAEAPKAEGDDEPPARFSPDAKAAWKDAPLAVKAEIRRALAENEKGLGEYRERWEPLKRFDDMARQSGTTLDAAMDRYVRMEQLLRQDPIRGMDAVARNMGLTLQQIAEHVVGQSQPQQPQGDADPRDQEIADLKGLVQQLQQQIGGVTQTMREGKLSEVQREIEAFKPQAPRFAELEGLMAKLITGGLATGLEDAYRMADRMTTEPQPAPPPAPAAPPAQTRPLSVMGAPASGSNPATRQPSPNARSAVSRALAQVRARA